MKPSMFARSMRAAALLLAISSFSLSGNPADAKAVKGAALGAAIDACLLASDAQTGESATKFGCCSREAGICVICPKPPSANNTCEVTPYRPNGLSGFKAMSPGILDGMQMQQ
jgi:hypothetical protein